ncbi:uncharacterized protein BO80DRAFT_462191 [Aspergillus ibericus CBS 121593]|uniref:Uncharacterized protein n=1 Tax=Aspergillus ibericus CBS 121593 TaxID=1448316 RepID=A0A395H952_9EURO|nr:hypothetical protein BO80DRAFT_462191 [Aspergillus ibericus CBS 121593]RAL04043.1 hypothetical protein BO80DRAFT_462191 [Aspergillus ibericus CBS 121593]
MEHLKKATTSILTSGQTFARDHPTALAVGGTGLALATAPLTGPALLGAVGFSATGPVAASLAAAWQSSIGVVQAGSLFSMLQGAAMGGTAAGAFTTASNLGVGMVGSAAVGARWNGRKRMLRTDAEGSEEAGDGVHCQADEDDDDDSLEEEFAKLLRIDMS